MVKSYEIYEGQLKNGEYDGWGRVIDYNGKYFIGKFSGGFKKEGLSFYKDGSLDADKIYKFYK